jgi:hypothetical protein
MRQAFTSQVVVVLLAMQALTNALLLSFGLQERKLGPLAKGGTLSGAAAAGKVCIAAGAASDISSSLYSHSLPTAVARSP